MAKRISGKCLVVTALMWIAGCGQGGRSNPATAGVEIVRQAVTGAYCSGMSADFCDDFQDGNATSPAWTVRDQAVASDFTVINDGDYVYRQGNAGTSNTRRISTAGSSWGKVMVEAKVKILSFNNNSANWVGLYARYSTSANTGYFFALGGDGKVSLRKKATGSAGTCINATYPSAGGCSQTVSPAIALNTWYTLKFVLNGSLLTGYLNGTRVIETTDTTYTTGAIGVGSTGGATFEADEIAVNRLAGACDAGFGVPKAAGTVCRAAASGGCDKAETCDGTSLVCPTDSFQPSGTVCRAAAAGGCDKAETCSGTSAACPADGFQPSGTVCRAASGGCDKAETCSGTSAACPADSLQPSGTVCRAVAGGCDRAETCNGTSAACPADGFLPNTTVCRAAAGNCDVAEKCSGTSAACPADSFFPSTTVCRAAAGPCDAPETCTGTSAACPADSLQPSGAICRAANGLCDKAETCSGTSTACPADGLQPSGTVCRAAAGACDVAEKCSGTSAACPADSLQASGTVCRAAAGACDVAEKCTGSSAACPADSFQPSSTVCRPSAGACDVAETCTGTSVLCPADGFVTMSMACRPAAGLCDAVETCTGTGPACPADALLPATAVCRPAAGSCDLAESCTGTSSACPADASKGGPPAPTGLAAAADDGKVHLRWNASEGATSYNLKRSTTGQGAISIPTTGLGFTDTGLNNGTTYSYVLSAVGACGESADSAPVTATPAAGYQSVTVSLPLPKGVSRDSVAVAANGTLYVNDRSWVSRPDGSFAAVSNAGDTGTTNIGADAKTGSVTSVAPVTLRDRATVTGDLTTAGVLTRQNNVTVTGTIVENATLTPPDAFSWTIRLPASNSGDVLLQPDAIRAIDPGSYAQVTVNSRAKLSLRTGVYHMTSLDVEPQGQLILDKTAGPVVVYVTGTVAFKGQITDAGGPAGNFLLVCLGNQDVFVEQTFTGTIVIPHAKLTLASVVQSHQGTFYAQSIEIHQNNHVVAVPFDWSKAYGNCVQFGCLPPTDQCHVLGVCDTGTGTCNNPAQADGVACNDGDLCTLTDQCQAGACKGANPKVCIPSNGCHKAGTCEPSTGVCSDPILDKVGCNAHLRMYGVAKIADGKYVAIFGYDSQADGSFHPATNSVSGQSGTTPLPPAYLAPGTHIGAFLPVFEGPSISWTVDEETVTAYADAEHVLIPRTVGTGSQVDLPGGGTVMLTPDLSPYEKTPTEPPLPSPPDLGDAFNGALAGQLSIGPTGAAVYTVPIAIPPGIAGMAPNLNLVYNSQGGNGIAGQGWELTGLSAIYRCPKTQVQDGYAQVVTMSDASVASVAGDGVCLDGKRLFYTVVGVPPGTPPPVGETFRTEMNDFSQITLDKTEGTFTVITKSGEIRHYGSKATSQVNLPQESPSSDAPQVTAIWALDKVVDPWGNYYEIEYNYGNADFTEQGLIVTAINYTGHTGSKGEDTQPFYKNQLTFSYAPRPDARDVRFGSSSVPKNRRLTSITTPRGTYTLNYAPDGDLMLPSRLKSVGYCSAADSTKCLKDLVFDWDGGGYDWDPRIPYPGDPPATHNYGVPTETDGIGTQFVDLNGDGRLDFVQAKQGGGSAAWRNTGSGWEKTDAWKLPNGVSLGKANDSGYEQKLGTMFADFDGDGLPDLIADSFTGTACGDSLADCTQYNNKPVVWFNRIKSGGGWSRAAALSGDNVANAFAALPAPPNWPAGRPTWSKLDLTKDQVADMNGDGIADLVNFTSAYTQYFGCVHGVYVLRGSGSSWVADSSYTFSAADNCDKEYRLFDLNRDGLPDLTGLVDKINTGDPSRGQNGTVWLDTGLSDEDPGLSDKQARLTIAAGDINGDGLYDMLYENLDNPCQSQNYCCWIHRELVLRLAAGNGWTDPPAGDNYLGSLQGFWGGFGTDYNCPPGWPSGSNGLFTLADLNADGLADVVVSHSWGGFWGGQVLVNNGHEWKDLDGFSSFHAFEEHFVNSFPEDFHGHVVPAAGTFVDLDGDGVTDIIAPKPSCHTYNGTESCSSAAWLNKFRPPAIKGFPNGVAQNTNVDYATITNADAQTAGIYSDSGSRDPGTRYFMLPLRVAASVNADDGVGGTSTTQYQYQDLRASATQRGPQGFKQVIVTDPTGMVTTTTYSQAFPYTGMPTSVKREQKVLVDETKNQYCSNATQAGDSTVCTEQKVLATKTETQYCDNLVSAGDVTKCTPVTGTPAGTKVRGVFVYPMKVTDTSYLRGSNMASPGSQDETVTTTTEYAYDTSANPATTTVTTESSATGEKYQKKIENQYGAAGSDERRMGKVTQSVVTTHRLAPDGGAADATITHTTKFEYEWKPALALTRKKVEPDASWPIRSETAYDYDDFGNVVATTSCASDFEHCNIGEDNPAVDPNNVEHPPFRTTTVSYDPLDFGPGDTAPVQTLSYGNGRYPVKTTNALNQTQFSAYDPLFGALVQSTGPNGIHTCYTYDALGNQTEEKVRCTSDSSGSTHTLTTTVARYLAPSFYSPAFSKVITVTKPPTSVSPSYAYADALGRTINTSTPDFGGGFTVVATEYNERGQVHRTSKPSEDGAFSTEMTYDWLGRISTAEQDLGSIDGAGGTASSTVTTTYLGRKIQTQQTVKGETRNRYEWKNVLGKVAEVEDAAGKHIWYTYDPDGNLKTTLDEAGNKVEIKYDVLGRKTETTDPDLGKWTYDYNGFGELIGQTDAKNLTTKMTYDQLGRMIAKTDPASGTAEWVYDKGPGGIGKLAATIGAPDPKLNTPCTIPNTTQAGGNRAGRSFTYTSFGEVAQVDECVDGETFSTGYGYDERGRQSLVTYPEIPGTPGQRFAVEYHYTQNGFLHYVADAADHKPYWVVKKMSPAGEVIDEETRNGVELVSVRNQFTGWLRASTATAKALNDTVIQAWEFGYDEAGNLRNRAQSMSQESASWKEEFTYDKLDRLKTSEAKIPSADYHMSEPVLYDNLGNVIWKDGKDYIYTGCQAGSRNAGPHAVCKVGTGTVFAYDANGNMTKGQGRTVEYNSANKPTRIESDESKATVEFAYGADGHRVVQSVGTKDGGETRRTVYVGLGATGKSIYERTTNTATGEKEHVQFLYAGGAHGGNAFALRIPAQGSSSAAMKYNLFDHLGSVTAMADEYGQVVGPSSGGADATLLGYDAWGKRRNPDGSVATTSFNLQAGHREYTGHETIPNVGLVNMNGRVYDPELGRFLTPDPNVQFVANLQSYNRYSYVLNNPLRYTDPTGYFLGGAFDTFVNLTIGFTTLAVCAGSSGIGCVAAFSLAATIYNTTSMLAGHVPFDQVVGMTFVGLVAGQIGGVGASAFGKSMAGMIVGGAVAGAVAAAITTSTYHGSLGSLGQNMLLAASAGALSAALAWAIQPINPVSQASANESQGGQQGGEELEYGSTVLGKSKARSAVDGQGSRAPRYSGRTLILYGDPGDLTRGDDVVWRLNGDNQESYELALGKWAKARGYSNSDFAMVENLADVKAAIASDSYSNIVYFGHSVGDSGFGYLMLPNDAISGSDLASSLTPTVRRVELVGCFSEGAAAEARAAAPNVVFNGAGTAMRMTVGYVPGPTGTVRDLSIVPYRPN